MSSSWFRVVIFMLVLLIAQSAAAQPAAGQAQAGFTDVYNVMFVKAAPGQADAVAKTMQELNPGDPMAAHFLMLRHQEGDDWDYCIIRHRGTQATVTITPPPADPVTATQAWHNDTFVAGPSWPEFSKSMMGSPGSVYVVAVHRAVPGHRRQLLEALNQISPSAKELVSQATLAHVEGGPWQFLTIQRYNSWQDLAKARAAAAAEGKGWHEVRQHSAYHVDTIADRVAPK
jgi:hypothetical protein